MRPGIHIEADTERDLIGTVERQADRLHELIEDLLVA